MPTSVDAWEQLFKHIKDHDHIVQLYDDDQLLVTKAGHYLFEGWKRGAALLVVATGAHRTAILEQLAALGVDPAEPANDRRLAFLDGEDTLDRLLVNGVPDRNRFDRTIGRVARELVASHGSVCAFGEMVGILWSRRQYSAALKLEDFWNRLIRSIPSTLFCAYPIDILSGDFDAAGVDAILRAHTHLLPLGPNGDLGEAVNKAMDDVLGSKAGGLREVIRRYFRPSYAAVPKTEAILLWLRRNLPQYAGRILDRARKYYRTTA